MAKRGGVRILFVIYRFNTDPPRRRKFVRDWPQGEEGE